MWGAFFDTPIFQMIFKVMKKGHHGVGLFFVLSGFLITYLLLHEAKTREKINAFGFFMRRLLRIWPLYFIVVLFGFFLFPLLPNGMETQNSLLHYSLFISNFEEIWTGWKDSISFLTVTWSVSIEEQFYMAWVALIAIIPSFRKGKNYPIYFITLILISIIFRFFNMGDERTIYFHTLSVVSDLAIGGLLSYVCFSSKILDRFKHMSKLMIGFIYILGLSIILASTKLFPGYLVGIERIVIGLFFAFIIFEQVYCSNSFYKADKVLNFFKLGEISYGIYMYHCIVIYFVQQIILKYDMNNSLFGFIAFVFASGYLTLILSRLSYAYIEQPILNLKKHFR